MVNDQQQTFLHYSFDEARAQRAVRFIETCCYLSKGVDAGSPLRLRPWQRDIIRLIFGWIDLTTGLRRYRKVFIFLPRKNGKSHLAAAIALYMLYGDGEKGADVILAANSREQAGIVYQAASGMVRQSPVLNKLSQIIPSTKRVLVTDSQSVLKTVSADAGVALGLDISALIYDEIAFAENRDLYDALTTASGSRLQPLQIFITTAGWDHEGIGYQLYRYAKGVLSDPKQDPTFLPIIYEISDLQDWSASESWHQSNPALGDFLSLETLQNACREAINNPSEQGKFRMFHANQWVQAAESWLDVAKWNSCEAKLDEAKLRELPCYVGLDLSATTDISALVALWVDGPLHYIRPFMFLPGDDLRERVKRDHAPYDAWAEQGHITLTPGSSVDYSFIKKALATLAEKYTIKAVGFDPWHATQFIAELEKDGFNCVKIRQGHESLGAPTKHFESLITGKKILQDGNPYLSWQVGNVTVRLDANANMVPDKKKSRHRIDGVAATIFALACALRLEQAEPPKPAPVFRLTVLG